MVHGIIIPLDTPAQVHIIIVCHQFLAAVPHSQPENKNPLKNKKNKAYIRTLPRNGGNDPSNFKRIRMQKRRG